MGGQPVPLTEPVGGASSPEALLAEYEAALAAVVREDGVEGVVAATGLDRETVAAAEAGEAADLDLRDVAAILALRAGAPSADAILTEVRDHLLLAMSSAMLDVDRIAADVAGDLDPKEVQGKVEGRHPTTLVEYARLYHYIAGST